MGKKSRLKRRKYNLILHEFRQYACTQCGLCASGTDANFCYEGTYVDNPKRFIKETLPKLKEIKAALPLIDPKQKTLESDEEFEYTLEEAFCDINICLHAGASVGAECLYKAGCLHSLRAQVMGSGNNVVSIRPHRGRKQNKSRNNKTWKKKSKQYVAPTPTFFCNDSFREEVETIIGNNTEQQNKGEESPGSSSAAAGGQVEDSKS